MSITACARVDQYRNHKRMCDQSRDVHRRSPQELILEMVRYYNPRSPRMDPLTCDAWSTLGSYVCEDA
jgi:hypothetical protein